MSSVGKKIRLNRFRYRHSTIGMIVPIDHGLTIGPVSGLKSVSEIAKWIHHPGISGIIAHKGIIERLADRGLLGNVGVMMHLNGMSTLAPNPDRKELVSTVQTAVRYGVDGVSVQLNFDGNNDAHNLSLLGAVVDAALPFGLPVLTMLYDKALVLEGHRIDRLRHLTRIAIELGTDAIKLAAPADLTDVPLLLGNLSEDAAIFFAGGSVCSDEDLVALTRSAVASGGAGLCIGRNVFQRPSPCDMLTTLSQELLQSRSLLPHSVEPSVSLFQERVKHGIH